MAIESVEELLSSPDSPIGLRIDGQAVQSPQGPNGRPLVGSFYEIFPDHLGNHYRLFRKYGHVIRTTNMGKTTYLTDSPEVAAVALAESAYMTKKINENHPLWGVKDNTAIFIGDTETENWRLAHKFLPPAMGPKAVRHYTPLMQECARESFAVFDELDASDQSWNVYQYMIKLASQTIGKFSLDTDLSISNLSMRRYTPLSQTLPTFSRSTRKSQLGVNGIVICHSVIPHASRLSSTQSILSCKSK